MEKILLISLGIGQLIGATRSWAETQADPAIKNLGLVGVIYVAGLKAKSQSVAVLRDRHSGRTLLLRIGDSLLAGEFAVSELGPQQVTLVKGDQQFILRVEKQEESILSAATSESFEAEEGNLNAESENPELPELETTSIKQTAKIPTPRFEPKILPEQACAGGNCPVK